MQCTSKPCCDRCTRICSESARESGRQPPRDVMRRDVASSLTGAHNMQLLGGGTEAFARRCKSRRSFVACQSRAAGERRLRRLPLATAYSQQALRRSTATNAFPTKRFGSSGSSSRSRGRELAETVVAVAATRGQRGGGGVGTAIICLV
ncbi:hypothetical protein C0Q70_06143 [Pomacea canaliculata]|uniref:Uncharacterized protein n=1 Tax=Pomacea canaliculata TaxID=400727 RepID=A0A2T7PN67_POMCA|nr:hypothetical protein C0Q70_06143 [Pomacea canaliculata]